MREREIEKRLRLGVKALGGKAYKITSPSNNGFPDRLVCLPHGMMVLVETKKPEGELSALQRFQIRFLRSIDCPVAVITNAEELAVFLQFMKEAITDGYNGK